jgi:hypothetical protein
MEMCRKDPRYTVNRTDYVYHQSWPDEMAKGSVLLLQRMKPMLVIPYAVFQLIIIIIIIIIM